MIDLIRVFFNENRQIFGGKWKLDLPVLSLKELVNDPLAFLIQFPGFVMGPLAEAAGVVGNILHH